MHTEVKSRVDRRSFVRVRLRSVVVVVVVVVTLSHAGAAAAADVPAAVTLSGQRVRLTPETHELAVDVTVHNDLGVALNAVDVGWLLAGEAKELENVRDPGPLYLDSDDPKYVLPSPGVMVVRRVVAVTVPPHGSAVASLIVDGGAGTPAVYRTHVLGYTLADASLGLLLRLLHGSAAADEKAAVDFFGLAGDAQARLTARRRLNAVSEWVDELTPRVIAPVPQHPTVSEAHERIYAVRALGVVGGPRAEVVLAQLRDRSDSALLDDLVRVALIDRLRGTRLETPLAFAVPPAARAMRDIVDTALADARDLAGQIDDGQNGLPSEPDPAINAPPASESPAVAAPPSDHASDPAVPRSPLRYIVPWAAALLAFIVTSRLLKGRRR